MRAILVATLFVSASFVSTAATKSMLQQPPAKASMPAMANLKFPKNFDPAKAKDVTDVAPLLKEKNLSEGSHVIDTTPSGLQLSVVLKSGQLMRWHITDNKGQPVPTKSFKRKTTCWECGVDKDGNTHCWKIPCPVIVGPWTPGKAIQ